MRINTIRYAALCVALVASVSMLGCKDKNPSAPKVTAAPTTAAEIDPRSKVIGVEPSGPTRETAATAPASKSEISKTQQSNAMPMPGQANDHSTLSPKATQKAKTSKP